MELILAEPLSFRGSWQNPPDHPGEGRDPVGGGVGKPLPSRRHWTPTFAGVVRGKDRTLIFRNDPL